MLTDDDLTRQLGAAFRGSTDDLGYAGRVPTPRSGTALGVPLVASAATIAALAGVWAVAPDDETGSTPPSAGPATASPAAPQAERMVTDTIEVAGYTFTYRHAAGDPVVDDVYALDDPGAVPDDATPIDAPEGVRAWVGTDHKSGDAALWVEAPTRNEGRLFVMLSPTWTTEQLADLFHHGDPRPVPQVSR